MANNYKIPVGIIEGFFGRSWSHQSRGEYAEFLAQHQFDFYIYAPKDDTYLRRQWQLDWPEEKKNQLFQTRQIFTANKIDFGIGLSPLDIWRDNQDPHFLHYKNRIHQINDLSPDILCILFDDMRGDLPDLAKIQIELVHIAANISNAKKIIFCPSYYSTDPILEKVFGKMPANYWQDLGKKLDPSIDIFWTGEKVCSESYRSTHLTEIESIFQRKVFLWDNYPVNDGAIKSQRLHLMPFHSSHHLLKDYLRGHAANPMNQACLSKIPLLSLSQAYQDIADIRAEKIFIDIAGKELGQELLKDAEFFQTHGLKDLDMGQKQTYINRYQEYLPNPIAAEVVDWLKGEYRFDPACLTE
jgi:hyaluronoglucosaminidase